MNNTVLQIKIRQRLNKLASNDFTNIEAWQLVEAFNKAQPQWCRRNLHGNNQSGEGDEQSTSRIDDLQQLLKTSPAFNVANRQTFYETVGNRPDDYLRFKRFQVSTKNKCCKNSRQMKVYLAEEANVEELLRDRNKKPSFEWGETFATFIGDKIRVYTGGDFEVLPFKLIYYRQPIKIQIAGIQDPYTGNTPATDVECEFNDDITELLLDECVTVLAGDIENPFQIQRSQQSSEMNN